MGKRKSSKKPQAKKSMGPLSSSFKCLFCHHEKAVSVKMDKGTMFGHLNCKKYTTPINNLSVAVDVYCDWVDACEEIREKQPKPQRPIRAPSPLTAHGSGGGASLNIRNKAIAEADGDEEDGEGEVDAGDEDEDEDVDADADDLEVRPKKTSKSGKVKSREYVEVDDDDDEEEEVDDGGREKRRRVDYDDDDDDE